MTFALRHAAMVAVLTIAFGIGSPVRADDSLYRDLGGKDKIAAFTADFVDLLVKDPRIQHHFKDTNIPRLKMLLTEQFIDLAGGPVKYSGSEMKGLHADMGIRNFDFNALVEDLQTAMDRASVPFFTQNKLLALLAPMQRDIVTK